ncbi:MAG: HD domain-containing protein [Candidatus Omnitrophica bacterium]|nr:HD domain-containing protein [Candidatus Omnitrophota bacterium]
MPRMFDILRGKMAGGDETHNPEKAAPEKRALSFPKEILKTPLPRQEEKEDQSLVSKKLIFAVKQHGVDSQEKADEIYENAVRTIKSLLAEIMIGEGPDQARMEKLYELLDTVFNQLVMGDNILFNLCEKRKEEASLPYHIVNVLILSSVIGLSMGFNKSRLSHLGLASIFYDVGIDSFKELTQEPRLFTALERKRVNLHIGRSLEIVGKIGSINDVVIETIRMHHERMDGNGYPSGVKGDDINPYAKILGLADTYEALTHTRPHRAGMNTHRAVRLLIGSMKSDFDSDVMKMFINKMSVYPIGSIVTLDTGEMARVVSVQPCSPLRPVIMMLKDANGVNVKEKITIDLSKQDFPAIKD